MSSLVGRNFQLMNAASSQSNVFNPCPHLAFPMIEICFPFFFPYKILYLHLFKLSDTKNKIFGRNFVSKRFSRLPDAKRNKRMECVKNVFKIYKHPLCGFRTQIRNGGAVLNSPDAG